MIRIHYSNILLFLIVLFAFIGIGGSLSVYRNAQFVNFYITYAHIYLALLFLFDALIYLSRIKSPVVGRTCTYPFFLKLFCIYAVFNTMMLVFRGVDVDLFKLLQFFLLNIFFLLSFKLIPSYIRWEKIASFIKVIGLSVAIICIVFLFVGGRAAKITPSGGVNALPVITAFIILMFESEKKGIVPNVLMTTILIFALLGSAARTAIISLIFVIIVYSLMSFKFSLKIKNFKKLFTFLFVVGIICLVLKQFPHLFDYVMVRWNLLVNFTSNYRDDSILTRKNFVDYFFANLFNLNISKLFFGYGIGNFHIFYGKLTYCWPHNTFIEIFVELGLIGFCLFTGAIVESFIKMKRCLMPKVYQNMFSTILCVYIIFLMSYGDMIADRNFYLVLFLMFNAKHIIFVESTAKERKKCVV